MSNLRPPAVAGLFYPAERELLAGSVERFIQAAAGRGPGQAAAVIAPHAGYVYSGAIAGHAYAAVAAWRGRARRVVVAGPAHRVYVTGIAVPSVEAFATPLGRVALDRPALERLAQLPWVETSDAAHAQEHCIEVQLPFLQRLLGDFELVPMVVGDASPAQMATALEAAWDDETLVVVSSDLSHYLSWSAARTRDTATAATIVRLEPTLDPHDACGAAPINGLLRVARQRGLAARLLDLRNSGDTAGDRERVVGYGAFGFAPGAAHG